MPASNIGQFFSVSDLVLIGTTLLLAGTAFLAPCVIEKWKHKFFSPKLDFKFFHKPPYSHITEMRGGNVRFPVYYFRFKVVNNGKLQAEQCEAVLESVWKVSSVGKLEKLNGFSPMPLKWSGVQLIRYLTIQPGRKVFCDIGRVHHPNHQPDSVYRDIKGEEKKQNKFFFELIEKPYAQWDCLVPGKYQIEIAIYSKNAKRISKKYRVGWSGIWKDEESHMLNELVVS